MQIDPKLGMWLNIAAFALASLTAGSWFGDVLPTHYAAPIIGMIGWLTSVMNFVLHAYSSPQPGPLAKMSANDNTTDSARKVA